MSRTIQSVVVESAEDRTNLAQLLSDFAFAYRCYGRFGCDRNGDYTRAAEAWKSATGEYVSADDLRVLCNEHCGAHNAPALSC